MNILGAHEGLDCGRLPWYVAFVVSRASLDLHALFVVVLVYAPMVLIWAASTVADDARLYSPCYCGTSERRGKGTLRDFICLSNVTSPL